jgi:hypothetical protein
MGNPVMNPEMSGSLSHSKSTNKFHDQLLCSSQVRTESTCCYATFAFDFASLKYS